MSIQYVVLNGGLTRTLPSKEPISNLVYYSPDVTLWVTATSYAIGDIVRHGEILYVCNTVNSDVAFTVAKWDILFDILTVQSIADASSIKTILPKVYKQVESYFSRTVNIVTQLNLKVVETKVSYDFAEVEYLQRSVDGVGRQCGVVMEGITFQTSFVTALNLIAESLRATKKLNMFIVLGSDSYSNDLSLGCKNVSVVISKEDGETEANVGNILGELSATKCSASIAKKDDIGIVKPVLTDGVNPSVLSDAVVDGIRTKRYIFAAKEPGVTGSFYDNDYTCDLDTSDYRSIHNVRTMNKVERETYLAIYNGVYNRDYDVVSGGKLANYSINAILNVVNVPLVEMRLLGEISDYKTYINPDVDVVSAGVINIEISILPRYTAEWITVVLKYTK